MRPNRRRPERRRRRPPASHERAARLLRRARDRPPLPGIRPPADVSWRCYGDGRSIVGGDERRVRIAATRSSDNGQQCHVRRSRGACGRPRSCRNAARTDGRPRAHRIRVGPCRRHRTADRERSPRSHDGGRPSQCREAGPASLSPARLAGGGADDGKHHAGGVGRSVRCAPAQRRLCVGPRDAALRAARTCYDHLAGRLGVALADALVAGGYAELAQRRRPRDRCRHRIARSDRHRCRMPCRPAAASARPASCAGPASIGANGDRISRERSGQPCARTASRRVGSAASMARAPSRSRRRGSASFEESSVCSWDSGSAIRDVRLVKMRNTRIEPMFSALPP